MQDGAKFGLVVCNNVQLCLFFAMIPTMVKYHLGAKFICSQLLLVTINSIPPLLPAASAMLAATSIQRLRRKDMHVADPQKLLAGAQMDCLLFDKTGTLTIGQVTGCCHHHVFQRHSLW